MHDQHGTGRTVDVGRMGKQTRDCILEQADTIREAEHAERVEKREAKLAEIRQPPVPAEPSADVPIEQGDTGDLPIDGEVVDLIVTSPIDQVRVIPRRRDSGHP